MYHQKPFSFTSFRPCEKKIMQILPQPPTKRMGTGINIKMWCVWFDTLFPHYKYFINMKCWKPFRVKFYESSLILCCNLIVYYKTSVSIFPSLCLIWGYIYNLGFWKLYLNMHSASTIHHTSKLICRGWCWLRFSVWLETCLICKRLHTRIAQNEDVN